jgi:two-component system sensor histidine kinase RegB
LQLRLRTLVWLRWLAVLGQTGAVLSVDLVLGFALPLSACLAVIATSAWLNIFLSIRWRTSARLHERYSALLLAYDILQLAALLYLTGGLENPFSFLFLVPVTVSATTLPLNRTIWLSVLAVVSVTVLAVYHLPLPWLPGEPIDLPSLYKAGVWAALVCGIAFATLYVSRVAGEAREMSEALSATETVLAHEQQLHALDGLAAAAAHELGTPLATIQLVSKELKRELPQDGPIGEDIDLLISQAERCRQILSRLADRDAQSDAMFARLKLPVMLEEIIDPLRGPDIDVVVVTKSARDADGEPLPAPVIPRNPAIKYGIANLLENAVDFARSTVNIELAWSDEEIAISISDDGPGFSQQVIDRLGDPFVTTRPGYGADGELVDSDGHHGMGLGFFIAKTLLERSGATVVLANRSGRQSGAVVRIAWPTAALAVDEPLPRESGLSRFASR